MLYFNSTNGYNIISIIHKCAKTRANGKDTQTLIKYLQTVP